jgi:pimeloyl-ACP methyl ester carboxylesterase
MRSSLRFLGRSSLLLCVLILLSAGFVCAWFASWRADRLASLNSVSDLEKTPQGLVEFVARGEGPPVLILHGAPGGYDQAMLLGSSLLEDHFHIVAPSRPGYLRTPLSTGLTPKEQADAMAGLIDEVEIPSVAVLASSSGTPAAVHFAVKHPQKVWALVLISPVLGKVDSAAQPERTEPGRLLLEKLKDDLRAWWLFETAERDSRPIISWMVDAKNGGSLLQRESLVDYVLNDPDQLDWFRSFLATFMPLSAREEGIRNDLVQLRVLADLPWEKVSVPTLLVHGTADKCVPFSEAETVARRIPGAILYPVAEAGHLLQLGPRAVEVQSKIREFLHQHSGGHSQR